MLIEKKSVREQCANCTVRGFNYLRIKLPFTQNESYMCVAEPGDIYPQMLIIDSVTDFRLCEGFLERTKTQLVKRELLRDTLQDIRKVIRREFRGKDCIPPITGKSFMASPVNYPFSYSYPIL